jgi:hydrogenase maturation protein HypF
MRAEIRVTGIVQGVGFRPFIYRLAIANALRGHVLNLGDAGVEVVVEGDENAIKKFISEMKSKRPPLASIENIDIVWKKSEGLKTFEIKKSSDKMGGREPSVIPPDIGICDDCIKEITDPENRRYNYFFTTCTNCGPRYTAIKKLPYDRRNTTMDEFPMCEKCHEEYTNPADRRYHAQTVACSECGPQVYLLDGEGRKVESGSRAIWKAGELLMNKKIIAIKGNGGFHLSCSAFYPDVIKRLRVALGRMQKPFALMAGSIEGIKSIAHVSKEEEMALTSYIKPIVVLEKEREMEEVAPELHNVGIMLPYTGLHVMIFQRCSHPIVMTSANMPGEPIIYRNEEAIKKLRGKVDYFLVYDRKIAHRCDDSVVRFVDGNLSLIRRSRGYVPSPVKLPFGTGNVLAFGAEMNVTSCVLSEGKAFLSPYIGNTTKFDTMQFLEEETEHMLSLTNVKPDVVAHDLHPHFATTKMAEEFGREHGIPSVSVQHHHAHTVSVMGEHGIGEAVGIAIDGVGYGGDGKIWGGEILHCYPDRYERIGHLEEQIMVGGDLATTYPLRMAAGVLYGEEDFEEFLYEHEEKFPHGKEEISVVLKQAKDGRGISTTSCGRILDAASALLGICTRRTYEGEPAMKLESHAIGGRSLGIVPEIEWGEKSVLSTSYLLKWLWRNRKMNSKNLAFSVEEYIAEGLAEIAVDYAKREHVKSVAVSGGCAYNEHIVKAIRRKVEASSLIFLLNEKVPAGDGGVSFGQAIVADAKMR